MICHTVWYFVVILFLCKSDAQNLGKETLFSGLDQLDFSSLQTAPRTVSPVEDNENLCNCNGIQPETVQNVQYPDQSMLLCICPNAVMTADYMIDMMSKVPSIIRRNVLAMVSTTQGTCGGAGSSGDVINFCDQNMAVSVFIHEAAHSFDKGKSGSDEWHDAVAQDSCVPDAYANSNYAEDFAQVAVVWSSSINKTPGAEYECMDDQLQLMNNYTDELEPNPGD